MLSSLFRTRETVVLETLANWEISLIVAIAFHSESSIREVFWERNSFTKNLLFSHIFLTLV
jgi:hypothetical protein